MDVSDVEDHIYSKKVVPTVPEELERWKRLYSIAMLIILDGVKDHIVPHLYGKKIALEMWKVFEGIY